MHHQLFAEHALLPGGWARDVLLQWNAQGQWQAMEAGQATPPQVPRAAGPVLPGMPNLHSHAFQRALAGLTEYRSHAQDSFWSWRQLMYRFAAQLGPAQLEAIATGLYVEMLEAGFTSVCEFQYLHHDAHGQAYADPAEMSLSLLRAAQRTGIGMTLLPVLYQNSGFGGGAPTAGQSRFIHSTEAMLRLLERLQPACDAQSTRLGLAPHSLRAVTPESLREVLTGLKALDASAPIHIHIAEQTAEVDACVAWSGQRPVAWLLDHAPVDASWCLVHATHMDANEYQRAAASGAVAGLCPSTEANLGDGIFEFKTWQNHQGAWGIGSDSHIAVNPAEDLMLLEYSQRLSLRQRNVAAHAQQPDVAQALWQGAVAGGAQAAARPVAGLAVGQQADFIVLDAQHPALAGLSPDQMLASHVFASSRQSAVAQVWCGGQLLVQHGRHALHDEAMAGLVQARRDLLQA
ncbi:formimidoylglutamate deiminase [Limnohabitans sp. 2KL-3]|uniref:formimidoylglutamate deiminase n=1 Tax=Limnohabitans sp. 2KL-3 TaxID=1100700 RepID=UPI000B1E8BD5|nr:formimidoylglutamate deiminase [Limnohabitans sp. 2KL-3]